MYILASLALLAFADVSQQINDYTASAVIIASSVAGLIGAFNALRKPKRTSTAKPKPKRGTVVAPLSQEAVDEIGARR